MVAPPRRCASETSGAGWVGASRRANEISAAGAVEAHEVLGQILGGEAEQDHHLPQAAQAPGKHLKYRLLVRGRVQVDRAHVVQRARGSGEVCL